MDHLNEETDPVWYAIFSEKVEGPYTLDELALDWRLTPQTLMRRSWESAYQPAWDFPLIRAILKLQEKEKQAAQEKLDEQLAGKNEVIALDRTPGPSFLWFILFIIIILFIILRYIQIV